MNKDNKQIDVIETELHAASDEQLEAAGISAGPSPTQVRLRDGRCL